MRILMLGSGTSSGVPRIGPGAGGDWGRCDPANPRNRRRRVSILVEHDGERVLVDTGPDLREQLIDARVSSLSAVFYSHDHADHAHGIDDLRGVFHAMRRRVPCYMDSATFKTLGSRFRYVFEGEGGYPASCETRAIKAEHRFGGLVVRPFRQEHGGIFSQGFRFEGGGRAIAYSTDISGIPEESRPALAGLDLWIVDALRREPHPTHSHLARTLGWIAEYRPREAWLTHMDHSMDHDALLGELPPGVSPGYDGRVWETG